MKNYMYRTMAVIMGMVLLLWFIYPYIHFRILNIGNETGILLSMMLILSASFWKPLCKCIELLNSHRAGRTLLIFIALFALVIILIASTATFQMIKAANNKPEGDSTLIVLGCKVIGKSPSLMLSERIDATYEYMIKHPECKAVLSGGKGGDETISEAKCMYNELIKKGIAPDRLFIEDKSTSTRENIEFSLKLIEKNNLCKDITIVSNEFHLYRASHAAKSIINDDRHIATLKAKTDLRLFPTYYVRELWGICYEVVF